MKNFTSKILPIAIGAVLIAGCGSSEFAANPGDSLASLTVTPQNTVKSLGDTQQFTATATFTSGNQVNATQDVTWTSSDPNILSIQSDTGLATANAEGSVTVTAAGGNLVATTNVQVQAANRIFVASFGTDAIRVFDRNATGNVAPIRSIVGNNTGFSGPIYAAVRDGQLFVTNFSNDSVTVHSVNDSGNVAPLRTLSGNNTGLDNPTGIAILQDELYVGNQNNSSVRVFPLGASGNVAPTRVIAGNNTFIGSNILEMLFFQNELFLVDQNSQMLVHNPASVGDQAPLRRLGPAGNTGLDDSQALAVDGQTLLIGDNDASGGTIRRFPVGASGDVAPTSTLSGNATLLDEPGGLRVSQSELFVANIGGDSVTVYPSNATGNTAPTRRIFGNSTLLSAPFGILLLNAQ